MSARETRISEQSQGRMQWMEEAEMIDWICADKILPLSPHGETEGLYTQVLVICPRFDYVAIGFYIPKLSVWRISGSPSTWNVTHWMPLPNMPRKLSE